MIQIKLSIFKLLKLSRNIMQVYNIYYKMLQLYSPHNPLHIYSNEKVLSNKLIKIFCLMIFYVLQLIYPYGLFSNAPYPLLIICVCNLLYSFDSYVLHTRSKCCTGSRYDWHKYFSLIYQSTYTTFPLLTMCDIRIMI